MATGMFTLNRKYALRSLQGRIINFEKGVPTYVPPQCRVEAASIGAEAVDQETQPDIVADESITLPKEPDGEERTAKIFQAFEAIEKRNRTKDFNAAGRPNGRAMTVALGFSVDDTELQKAWYDYRERDTLK